MALSDRYNEVSSFFRTHLPPATRFFFIANVALFLLYWVLSAFVGSGPYNPFYYLECRPAMVRAGCVWQLATYAFLHASPMHLFGNMLALWFFGSLAEQRIGTAAYGRVYIVAALAAGLVHTLLYLRAPAAPAMLGASGAVMAVLVVCAWHYFDLPVYLILWPFPLKLGYLVLIFLIIDALYLIGPGPAGVANHAHLIGAAIGFAYVRMGWNGNRSGIGLSRAHQPALWRSIDVWRFQLRAWRRRLWPFGRRGPARKAKVRTVWDDDYFRR